MQHESRRDWLVPAGLIILSLVPVAAGMVRLTELSTGAEITPENARYFASPIPVVIHIVSVTVYCLLGAFQFSARIRRRNINWHRTAGRTVLVPLGLVAALSGLWMVLFYPQVAYDSGALYFVRLFFGSTMVVSILLGFAAVLRRDIATHRAWMIRGYAIGLGAGTQVFTHLPLVIGGIEIDQVSRAVAMTAGWVINVAVAEWIIRGRPLPGRRAPAAL